MFTSFKEEINKYRKDWVHRSYARIIKDFKDYDKISKTKMLDEVFNFYKDYNNILSICTYKELKLLEMILNSNKPIDNLDKKYNFEKHELHDKFLMFLSYNNHSYSIPSEIQDSVKLAINNIDKNYFKYKDETNDLLIGILKVYGILTIDDLKNIISNYIKVDDKLINHINNDKLFSFYTYSGYYDKFIIYEPYYEYEDELLYFYEQNKNMKFNIRKKDEIIYLRYHQFNDKNPKIKKFINEVEKLNFFHFSLYNHIEKVVVSNENRDNLIESFISIPALKNFDLTKYIELMEDAMNEMASPAFKGASLNEYIKEKEKDSDRVYYNTYNKVKNNKEVQEYKEIRQNTQAVFNELMNYAFNLKYPDKYINLITKNNLLLTNPNDMTSLLLFHSLNDEKNLLDTYCDTQLKIFNINFNYFVDFQNSYVESLFRIKKFIPEKAQVVLEDIYSNKEYTIMDVALSSSKEELIGSYIYTSLVTIKGYTFTTDYSFVILGSFRNDNKIKDEINKEIRKVKCTTNINTKRFITCFKISSKENNKIKLRKLE